jgi:hypothetical protein
LNVCKNIIQERFSEFRSENNYIPMVKLKTQTPQNVSSNESMFDVKLAFITFVACIIYACWIEKDSAALSGMYLKNVTIQGETLKIKKIITLEP